MMTTRDNNKETRDVSRREFVGTTAAGALAGSAAVLGGTTVASAANQDRKSSDAIDTSVRWTTKPGDLYNEKMVMATKMSPVTKVE